jgi:hypothetical protein
MFQLILTIYTLIFAALNLSVHNLDGLSYSSDEFDENFEVSKKSKSTNASKKKKPKRNRSAFIIFSSETRAKLRSENLNSNEMMVKLAEMWKSISDNEKKKYYDLADQEKNRYMMDLNNFYMQNPNEVIQNKTKKNHIKKPCSAYAIYLKETKKDIKNENPDLKMADILKVVAERWKILPEDKRFEFQRKAQIEKEETQAKLNQQNGVVEEYVSKKDSSKKTSSNTISSKRGQKSIQEPVKIENDFYLDQRTDSYESFEEPMLMKHQNLNVAFNYYSTPTIQENLYRPVECNNVLDMTLFNQGLRLPQNEYFQFQRLPYREDYSASNISNLLNYLPQSMFFKQSSVEPEKVIDQCDEPCEYVKDEYVSYSEDLSEHQTTATNTTPKSNNWSSQSKLSSEVIVDDFKLDDFDFDRTLETFNFRETI